MTTVSELAAKGSAFARPPKTPRKPRPPRKTAARSLSILEPAAPDTDGWMALLLNVGKDSNVYLVREIDADFGIGFEVEKLDDAHNTVEVYHVNLADRYTTCTCPGHSFHSHCKHSSALQTLVDRGTIARKPKHACCPNCYERVDAPGLCPRCTELEAEFAAYHQQQEMEAGGIDPWDCPEAEERYMPADEPPQLEECDYFDQSDVA